MRKLRTFQGPRLVGASVLALLAACSPAPEAAEAPADDLREFTVEIVDDAGLEARLADRGAGQLLNFWAMWCAPCVKELPEFAEAARECRERGGTVWAVSYDLMVPGGDPATIVDEMRAFLEKRGLDVDVLIYDEDDYDLVNARYSLPGEIPVTLALDSDGTIVDREDGSAHLPRFRELVDAALAP